MMNGHRASCNYSCLPFFMLRGYRSSNQITITLYMYLNMRVCVQIFILFNNCKSCDCSSLGHVINIDLDKTFICK